MEQKTFTFTHIVTALVILLLVGKIALGFTNPQSAPPVGAGGISVDSIGSVGIGTTVPGAKLHIKSNSTQLGITSSAAGGGDWRLGTGLGGLSASTFGIYDQTNGIERLSIDSFGNVALGASTPSSRLSIEGGFDLNGTSQQGERNVYAVQGNNVASPDTGVTTRAAMTIGVDGLPIIVYGGSSAGVKVLHCGDMSCKNTSTNKITALDNTNTSSAGMSIIIGSDGRPFIAYFTGPSSSVTLRGAKCAEIDCSDLTVGSYTSLTSGNYFGLSMIEGPEGFPLIIYSSSSNIFYRRCLNVSCSSGANVTLAITVPSGSPYNAIAIGANGLPVIAYRHNSSPNKVRMAVCSDISCDNSHITEGIDVASFASDQAGDVLSMTIGNDGFPVVTYLRGPAGGNQFLSITHCATVDCTGSGETNIKTSNTGTPGFSQGVTIGTDGRPIFFGAFYTGVNNVPRVIKCLDIDCGAINDEYQVDSVSANAQAIAVGSDGLPILAYTASNQLKVLHCGSENCIPYWTRR